MIRRFLLVHPSDLKFPIEVNKVCTCSLNLVNMTDLEVAFKVKTTQPNNYFARPNLGIISPGSTCVVRVSLQAQKVAPCIALKKAKFLIQSVVAQNGDKFRDVTSEMFRKEGNNDIQEYKLRVVFVSGNPPSPIPEASENGSSSEASELDSSDPLSRRKSLLNNGSDIAKLSRDKRLEEWAVISTLMEERDAALVQNNNLQHELEILRKQQSQGSNRVFLACWILVNIISFLLGYCFR